MSPATARPKDATMSRRPTRKRSRVPLWLRITAAGFTVLLAWTGYQAWDATRRAPGADAPVVEFEVEGLDCPVWCAVRLSDAIDGLDGAHVERLDRGTGRVTVRHDPARQDVDSLRAVFEARGFPVVDAKFGTAK